MKYAVELDDAEARAIVYGLRNDGSGLEKAIADQIEQQLPKPIPPEPTGDFIVLEKNHWPPFVKKGEGLWTDQDSFQFETWDELTAYFRRGEFIIYRPESRHV